MVFLKTWECSLAYHLKSRPNDLSHRCKTVHSELEVHDLKLPQGATERQAQSCQYHIFFNSLFTYLMLMFTWLRTEKEPVWPQIMMDVISAVETFLGERPGKGLIWNWDQILPASLAEVCWFGMRWCWEINNCKPNELKLSLNWLILRQSTPLSLLSLVSAWTVPHSLYVSLHLVIVCQSIPFLLLHPCSSNQFYVD